MEFAYQLAHNMFKDASIFSFVSVGQGNVLALDNPLQGKGYLKREG